MKKAIIIIISVILVCASIIPVTAQESEDDVFEIDKVYCTATIDDDFTDENVIVMLNRETSRKLADYTPEDFPEIECVRVYDLLSYSTAKYREIAAAGGVIPYYYQTLCITLAEPGKQNVLDAIKALEQRDDIYLAEPDYIAHIEYDDGELMVEPVIVGDVYADGKVNARDVTELMSLIVHGWNTGINVAADFNGDGKINAKDVSALMKSIVADH